MDISVLVRAIGLVTYARSIRSTSSPSSLLGGGGSFSTIGCASDGAVSLGFFPEEALSVRAGRSFGVSKSSLLPPRVLLVPRGILLLAFAVKVSTCFAREATSLSCSSDFF
ncbi:hypothetical protein Bca4012_009828 [Brassica carinata]